MKSLLFLICFVSFSVWAGPLQEINSREQFDSYINESQFNGVLVVKKNDTMLFAKAFGVKDFETNTSLSLNDKFQIGSVSKQFTAAALLKLQQENKLSLDDDVVKYLPQYEAFRGIKIRDILNHSSGIANYTDQQSFWQMVDFDKTLSLEEILNFTATLAPDFSPRSKWKYSNSGYILAGRIVEVVSGQNCDQYIKANFLEPLAMNNTGYSPVFHTVSDVVGHSSSAGVLAPVPEFNLSWALSAGALYSTAEDLLKWTDIYDRSKLLSEASKTEMQTPFLNNYALGVEVQKFNDDVKIAHGGRTPGFTTNLIYLKTSQLKIVKFDNTDTAVFDPSVVALNFFTKGNATALKLKPFTINKALLNDYTGFFGSGKMIFQLFIKNENLYLQPNDGQPPYLLIANDTDSFRLMAIAGEEFVRDQAGQITELKHYQNGNIGVYKKQTGLELRPVGVVTEKTLSPLL